MEKRHIRPIALCLIEWQGRILVEGGHDRTREQYYYRPLGGGIDFGEMATDAAIREIQEEIGEEVKVTELLGVFENIFTLEEKPGHEVVFLFRAEFVRLEAYGRERFPIIEVYGESEAVWVAKEEFLENRLILYPTGLTELLKEA